MKNRYRLLPFLALLFLALLTGCAKADPALRGKWSDLNSDMDLVVGGRRLTFSRGDRWSQSYPYVVDSSGGTTVLKGTGSNGDLGLLSPLTLQADGSLVAYQVILDGESRRYRFVRPEAMEALLEIRDYSSDLPKEIESHEIRMFSLSFRNEGNSYGLDNWPSGLYFWEIEPAEEGTRLYLRAMGSSYIALDVTQEVNESWLLGLDRRIRELGIPEHNGYRFANEVDRTGWSLQAEYASGEKLALSAGGDAAESCVFDLAGLMEYVRPLAEEAMK